MTLRIVFIILLTPSVQVVYFPSEVKVIPVVGVLGVDAFDHIFDLEKLC